MDGRLQANYLPGIRHARVLEQKPTGFAQSPLSLVPSFQLLSIEYYKLGYTQRHFPRSRLQFPDEDAAFLLRNKE